jgi:hypothetical protein
MKSLKLFDHLLPYKVGAAFVTIRYNTLAYGSLIYGGSPSEISNANIP